VNVQSGRDGIFAGMLNGYFKMYQILLLMKQRGRFEKPFRFLLTNHSTMKQCLKAMDRFANGQDCHHLIL
jgi:hypothetical protein